MSPDTLNDLIAERTLTLLETNGNLKQVIVRLGKPQTSPLGSEYYCEVQIVGLGNERASRIFGIDAFQALELSLKYISFRLHHTREESSLTLYCWEEGDDMGFPPLPLK
jgi:hypothetical protein